MPEGHGCDCKPFKAIGIAVLAAFAGCLYALVVGKICSKYCIGEKWV